MKEKVDKILNLLPTLSEDEIKKVLTEIKVIIKNRKKKIEELEILVDQCAERKKIHFQTRYGRHEEPHFVAKLTYDNKSQLLERIFIDFDKSYDQYETYLMCDYYISPGEIYDIRSEDGRFFYLISSDCEMIKLGSSKCAEVLNAVKTYLKYKHSPEQLLEVLGIKESSNEIPEELRDD